MSFRATPLASNPHLQHCALDPAWSSLRILDVEDGEVGCGEVWTLLIEVRCNAKRDFPRRSTFARNPVPTGKSGTPLCEHIRRQ